MSLGILILIVVGWLFLAGLILALWHAFITLGNHHP